MGTSWRRQIAGDKIIYQGLSTEEVADLVVKLKHKDQPKVWDGRIPYLGLTAFQESDAQFFFGRESLVDELLERVRNCPLHRHCRAVGQR